GGRPGRPGRRGRWRRRRRCRPGGRGRGGGPWTRRCRRSRGRTSDLRGGEDLRRARPCRCGVLPGDCTGSGRNGGGAVPAPGRVRDPRGNRPTPPQYCYERRRSETYKGRRNRGPFVTTHRLTAFGRLPVLAVALLAVGCSGEPDVLPVTGTVKVDGQPAEGVQ